MKTNIFLVLIVAVSLLIFNNTSCTKDNFTHDGYYSGSFTYQGLTKFDALIINGNYYEEVPSGGALDQKFPCLTKGTYIIKGNTINFTTSVEPDCLCYDCLLKGEYRLIQSGRTIEFQKEAKNGLQIYMITLTESGH
jgi:hypothetical protein